jgi:dienelactone hydrolase
MTTAEPAGAGRAMMDLLRDGKFAEIREMFTPSLRPLVSAESVRAAWAAELDRHGAVLEVGPPVTDPAGPTGTLVRFPVTFERGAATVLVTVGDDGRLGGIQLLPAGAARPAEPWQPPDYADPTGFDERDLTVGSGPLAVPGTLTLPATPGPHPAVVLLAGSGPMDRDETFGRNKPFNDLAWGLATRGIAVLRFDKVTYAHHAEIAGIAGFTADDEYLRPALAAVRLLRDEPGVDPDRVFVLGHSMGGTLAPRVGAADPRLAGLVLLAGGVQPIQWATVRQLRYLHSLSPGAPGASAAILDTVERQARAVDRPDLSAETPAGELPFGVPAAYWLDLRGYDPAAVAAKLGRPILVLQGGRDYQVTVEDDLSRWRAALDGRPDVTIRVYDADNHLFFPGRGPSTPAEYEPVQHMDPAVVSDIAAWLS